MSSSSSATLVVSLADPPDDSHPADSDDSDEDARPTCIGGGAVEYLELCPGGVLHALIAMPIRLAILSRNRPTCLVETTSCRSAFGAFLAVQLSRCFGLDIIWLLRSAGKHSTAPAWAKCFALWLASSAAALVVCPNALEMSRLVDDGCEDSKLALVHPGVDTRRFCDPTDNMRECARHLRAKWGVSACCALSVDEAGHEDAISAVRAIASERRPKLVLVGSTSRRLQRLCDGVDAMFVASAPAEVSPRSYYLMPYTGDPPGHIPTIRHLASLVR